MNGRHSHTLLIKEHDRVKKENHDLKARIENYELQRKSDNLKLTGLMRQLEDCKKLQSDLIAVSTMAADHIADQEMRNSFLKSIEQIKNKTK